MIRPPVGPLEKFLVIYTCQRWEHGAVVRAVQETDVINAILAARDEERTLTGDNCPDCVLGAVRIVG